MLRVPPELLNHFEAYGTVSSIRLVYNQAGRRRDFGFVQFKLDSAAQQALLAGSQHNIAGRLVTVQPLRQKLHSNVSDSTSSKSHSGQDTTQNISQLSAGRGKVTCTRRMQSSHRGSISTPPSLSLLDILHQVPTLPGLLTTECQKALSATCRSLRESFLAQIQVVTVMCKKDYAWVVNRRWPQLSMVILTVQQDERYRDCSSVSPLANRRHVLFNVLVSAEGNSKRTIVSMLKPLHAPAAGLACSPLAARQLAHQMTIKWPCMNMFMLTAKLDGVGREIASQLAQGTWTSLAHLTLSRCGLEAPEFTLLSQGNWPLLRSLDVSYNCLDAEGMASLVKGNWPLLTRIDVGSNPTLDASAIAHLSAANWPVDSLILSNTHVSADMVAELADLQLPFSFCSKHNTLSCCNFKSAQTHDMLNFRGERWSHTAWNSVTWMSTPERHVQHSVHQMQQCYRLQVLAMLVL